MFLFVLLIAFSLIPAIYTNYNPGSVGITKGLFFLYPFLVYHITNIYKENSEQSKQKRTYAEKWFTLFLFYSILNLLYGLIVAKYKEDYHFIWTCSIPNICVYFCFYLGRFNITLKKTFTAILLVIPPCAFLLYRPNDLTYGFSDFQHTVYPLTLFLLAFCYLSWKCRILLIMVSLLSIFYDLDVRANVLNLFFLGVLSLIGTWLNDKLFCKCVFVIRRFIFFFTIANLLTHVVWDIDVLKSQQIISDYGFFSYENRISDYLDDSRSRFYEETTQDLLSRNLILFGVGAGSGVYTSLAEVKKENYAEHYYSGIRTLESAMGTYLLQGGLLYIFVYSCLLISCSMFAWKHARNRLARLFSCWAIWLFLFSFFESPNLCNIATVVDFVVLGACCNKEFCELSDEEIKKHINNLLNWRAKNA